MQPDPFGNLQDWGHAMELLTTLSDNGKLNECQPGLARILAFQGNWRIREETLKRLEDEHRAFLDFLQKLREAKDKAEFDQFMSGRGQPAARD